ncbi:MAG: phenylacetate--CoA ligase, partial [Firmicutes bacterium]|nr:phenylacetate--CoA ligase [Bacillota bacterium]
NVFPSQIETVLLNNGYEANYQLTVDRKNNSDTIACDVEWLESDPPKDVMDKIEREGKLVARLKSMLGIVVKVKLVEPKSIPRSEGKAVRIIDKRNLFEESTLK